MRLQLTNDLSALATLMEKLDAFVSDEKIGEKAGNQIRLCLDELVTNVVSYGFDDGQEGKIVIEMTRGPNGVSVHLEDNGKPFNPFEEAAEPDLDAGVDDRAIGGLGVFFVTSMAKDFGYTRENGRNIVNLTLDID